MQDVKRRLKIFLALFAIVTLCGTGGFMVLEGLSFADAFYYNIVTMSTVGYGDIHPTRPISRLATILLIFMGGATFLGVIANATEMLLLKREARDRIRKVNMVLGVFFSEVGHHLLRHFASHDTTIDHIRSHLLVRPGWKAERFAASRKALKQHIFQIDTDRLNLSFLHTLLAAKRKFLVGLLENPALLEQEAFSDTLLAVFHLGDELDSRESLSGLPETDRRHLAGDMNRAYQGLVDHWLLYLGHLKDQYPYLFSLAVRKNPFDPQANPTVLQ
jgi:voltage-gated potassium channel